MATTAQNRFDAAFTIDSLFDKSRLTRADIRKINNYTIRNTPLMIRDRIRIENRVVRVLSAYVGTQIKRISDTMVRRSEWDNLVNDALLQYRQLKTPTRSDASVRVEMRRGRRSRRISDFILATLRRAANVPIAGQRPTFDDLDRLLRTTRVLFAESGAGFARRLLSVVPDDAIIDITFLRKQDPPDFSDFDNELVDIVFGTPELQVLEAIKDRQNKITSETLSDAAFGDLKDTISDSLYSNMGGGEGARKLAERIGDNLQSAFSKGITPKKLKNKLMLWARTEGTVIQNDALMRIGQQSGMDGKIWQTSGDSRVRPDHNLNEGDGIIPIADTFSDGSTNAGSGSVSPFNCRCVGGPAMLPKSK